MLWCEKLHGSDLRHLGCAVLTLKMLISISSEAGSLWEVHLGRQYYIVWEHISPPQKYRRDWWTESVHWVKIVLGVQSVSFHSLVEGDRNFKKLRRTSLRKTILQRATLSNRQKVEMGLYLLLQTQKICSSKNLANDLYEDFLSQIEAGTSICSFLCFSN